MMTLSKIRDWLKSYNVAEHYYIGKLDNKQDKSLGVYTLKQSGSPVRAVGTKSTYDVIGVSILLHWNNNADETERAARTVYEVLENVKDVKIDDTQIYMIELLVPEPVDVGSDDKSVYERVIEFKIYFER